MATYASLSKDQKEDVQAFMSVLRDNLQGLFKQSINAGVILSMYDGGISDIIDTLDIGQTIPNRTGREGALPVTTTNLVDNLMVYISEQSLLSTSVHRDNIAPATGARNLQVS
jgi:hypothetical protein